MAKIAEQLPLTAAEIHAALSFLYDHRKVIEQQREEIDAWVAESFKGRSNISGKYGSSQTKTA